tara:strand:- start:2890 stop:4665 length:1776 start_codon:yes stop_codon:yes gene_type:complete
MKNSDKVAQILVENNIKDIFMVTGGAAMHLNDSLSRNTNLNATFFHHEQSCAMAADGYSKASGKVSVICVTAGPGGINTLNGVFGAYGDSIPMLILSGQVRTETLNFDSNLRQLGDQEAPIVDMVKKITKYSKTITKKDDISFELNKALKIMNSGRKGPVWIDIPIDVQGDEYIEKNKSNNFILNENNKNINSKLITLSKKINESKRPVVLAGGGVWSSNSVENFRKFIKKTDLPVLTAFNGHDLMWENHENFYGRAGTLGDRSGNLILECSDLILVLGSSLNIRQIGYNFDNFGKDKFFCYVDIDKSELVKKTIANNVDLSINTDLNKFFNEFNCELVNKENHKEFKEWAKTIKTEYSIKNEGYIDTKELNPYIFCLELSEHTKENDIFVTANATAAIVPNQALLLKKNQRFFTNSTSGSMGYGLPAAIGSAISSKNKRIICFEGDGSLQMNIQELATIAEYDLNILLFVISNNGYHSIRQTQNNYFSDNLIGIDSTTGLSFPDLKSISQAHKLDYLKVDNYNYKKFLHDFNKIKLPLVVELKIDNNINFQPRVKSRTDSKGNIVSSNLYDMHPYIDDEEMKNILAIKNS